jgi:acyl-[acyl-carrier-protein]-phospholipid O-acyltransferase/long-chain-fatty-acid--[acyl-carrier-protein] ligase
MTIRLLSFRFAAYLATVFFTAFNDNLFRWAAAIHLVKSIEDNAEAQIVQALVGILFVFPFILFSPYAGYFADRFSKRMVLVWVKFAEILVMSAAFLGVLGDWVLYPIVFLMATQSAFFGPSKYGILPEMVDAQRLVRANSWVNAVTMVAILLGTIGATMVMGSGYGIELAYPICAGVAVFGFLVSLPIARVPAANPARPFRLLGHSELLGNLRSIRRVPGLLKVLGAVTFYWLVAFFFMSIVIPYAKFHLGLDESSQGRLLTFLTVGIVIGSVVASVCKNVKLATGFMPIGALGMGTTAMAVGLFVTTPEAAYAGMVALGIFAGLYSVPMLAYFQFLSPASDRGSNMATMNCFSFTGMLAGGALLFLVSSVPSADLFWILGASILALGAVQVLLMPDTVMWLGIQLLVSLFYRVRYRGRENVPAEGGAVVASNHVSLVDAFFLMSAVPRPIRFVIDRGYYDHWFFRPFCKAIRTIPVAGGAVAKEAIVRSREAVEAGDILGIFPEGQITRTGLLNRFRGGVELIAGKAGVPIVPVHLDRVWGSIFSFERGRFVLKWPKRIPYPVTVSVGEPMEPTSTAFDVRRRIEELASEAFRHRLEERRPLPVEWVRRCKRWRGRRLMADTTGADLSCGEALVRSVLLSKLIRERCAGQERVGVLMPPTVAGAIANIASMMAGKVPVNLNWTASPEAMRAAMAKAELKTVLTSRLFLKKAKLEDLPEAAPLEEWAKSIGTGAKIRAWLACRLLPRSLLTLLYVDRKVRRDIDRPCTVIFSSGSTGDPKGVVLTHANILSNLFGLADLFRVEPPDCIVGILPFFHSFGFTATLCLPFMSGIKAVYHPNPLDPKGVGEAVRTHKGTILLSTPTFLHLFTRSVPREDFASLKHVIVGAEKLPNQVGAAFREKFGIEPREGYGCTELSPIVSLNIPDFDGPGLDQPGTKPGTIGHPLPGVLVRVVDPETGVQRGAGEEGLILVRGPNVMAGYLGDPARTAEAMREGWYVTGDIGKVDEDGFITLTDRLSRFSKIGGEMVPHIRVEEAIQEIVGGEDRRCIVTAVPDGAKGERLAVVYTDLGASPADIVAALRGKGLPNLWIPKADSFVQASELPILASGKVDLRRAKQLAIDRR